MLCPVQEKGNAELLLRYCDRTLDPETQSVLERHMQCCADCSKVAEQQQALWKALDCWEPEPISADFDRRLYSRIEQESRSPWWQRIFRPGATSWRPALSVATACVTILAVVLIRTPQAAEQNVHSHRVETIDAEQVDRALEDMEMLRQFQSVASKGETESSKAI